VAGSDAPRVGEWCSRLCHLEIEGIGITMDKETKRKRAEHILATLGKQKFYDWYTAGDYDLWITGCENAPSKEVILKYIEDKFLD